MTAKTEAPNAAKLASFLKKHAAAGHALKASCEPEGIDLVDLFVHSYLLWQAPSADATAASAAVPATREPTPATGEPIQADVTVTSELTPASGETIQADVAAIGEPTPANGEPIQADVAVAHE